MSRSDFPAVCDIVAEQDLVLHKAIPRGPDHLLLDLRRPDGSTVAGQWFADHKRAHQVATSTSQRCQNQGVRLIEASGVVLQPGGADRRLRTLSRLVAASGSSLVAHRPERRAVVRQTSHDGGVVFTKAVRHDRLHDLLPAGQSPAIPGVGLPRVIGVDRAGCTVSTEALPGRLLHDLLGDSQLPEASLTSTALAVGAAVARLHSAVPPMRTRHHDAAAELATTQRWWAHAAAYRLLDLDGPVAREGFAAARRLLTGPAAPSTYLHRDLHDRQLLVTASGEVGMLDFDLASIGEPALDLANLLVHLELRARQGHCTWKRARACGLAVLQGYDPDPLVAMRLPGYALSTKLRLAAVYSFRPGGRQAVHDLLTLGLDAISDPGGQRSQLASHRSRHAASTHPALNFDGYLA
ncbi:MAG: aminoglycoside phosphotransferase family protein [Hymenobacter sp.]|jgi:hypothetical protein